MNRLLFVAVVLTTAMVGCTTVRMAADQPIVVNGYTFNVTNGSGFVAAAGDPPDAHAPRVFVTPRERIVVNQEPVRPSVRQNQQGKDFYVVTFALPLAQDKYFFANTDAIKTVSGGGSAPPSDFKCILPSSKAIACFWEVPARPTNFKYAITVTKTSGGILEVLDPWVYQN